jgi:hypothetical protein
MVGNAGKPIVGADIAMDAFAKHRQRKRGHADDTWRTLGVLGCFLLLSSDIALEPVAPSPCFPFARSALAISCGRAWDAWEMSARPVACPRISHAAPDHQSSHMWPGPPLQKCFTSQSRITVNGHIVRCCKTPIGHPHSLGVAMSCLEPSIPASGSASARDIAAPPTSKQPRS